MADVPAAAEEEAEDGGSKKRKVEQGLMHGAIHF